MTFAVSSDFCARMNMAEPKVYKKIRKMPKKGRMS